jgi:hypothetical protein
MYIQWLPCHETSLEIGRLRTIKPVDIAKHSDNINREGGGNGSILCNTDGRKKKLSVVITYAETEHMKTGKFKNTSRPETIHNFIMTGEVCCDVFLFKVPVDF